jgi:sulfopyruvate decarboxylase TPP-binding subunit
MMANSGTANPGMANSGPRGADIIGVLKAARVEFVAAVPDIVTSAGLLWPISRDPALHLIRLCKEDEASRSAPAARSAADGRFC